MSNAVFELLRQLNDEIEGKLAETDQAGLVKVYIFGGCAVHMYTNARGSNDLDIEVEAAEMLDVHSLVVELDTVYFTDPVEGDMHLDLDDTFQIGITPVVFPDYKERAIPLNEGAQKLHIYLVSPLDIAISKLSRCATDDIKDIVEIYRKGRFTLDEFKEAAREALDYTATPGSLQQNIVTLYLRLKMFKKHPAEMNHQSLQLEFESLVRQPNQPTGKRELEVSCACALVSGLCAVCRFV